LRRLPRRSCKARGCRVETAGALARRIAVDQTFVQHVKRDPGRGARRAFAVTTLKQERDALFDRELEVLHVAEVLFERVSRLYKFVP
jgi:hypothetical protein